PFLYNGFNEYPWSEHMQGFTGPNYKTPIQVRYDVQPGCVCTCPQDLPAALTGRPNAQIHPSVLAQFCRCTCTTSDQGVAPFSDQLDGSQFGLSSQLQNVPTGRSNRFGDPFNSLAIPTLGFGR